MANARAYRQESNLPKGVSRINAERWRSFRTLCGVERSIFRRVYSTGGCRLRCVLWPLRTKRPAGPDDHPNGAKTRLLLFVALCRAFFPASIDGDAGSAHRPGDCDRCFAASPISFRRGREKLAPAPNCCGDDSTYRRYTSNLHSSRGIYPMEPAHERME